jgi:hypothetical protein
VESGRPEKGRGILESPVMDEMKRTLKVGLMFQLKLLAGASIAASDPVAVDSRCRPV